MRRPQNHGLKLPRQLLDEIGGTGASGRKGGRAQSRNGPGARKDRRKAEREQKKEQKRHHQQSRRDRPIINGHEGGSDSAEETPEPASRKLVEPQKAPGKRQIQEGEREHAVKKKKRPAADIPLRSPSPDAAPKISRTVRDKLAEDDAEIAALEKKLGLKGKKSKSLEDDGLDSLLEGIDEAVAGSPSGKRKRTEEEEWLENKRKKARAANRQASPGGEDTEEDSGLSSAEFSEDESELEDMDMDDLSGTTEDEEVDDSGFEGFEEEQPLETTKKTRENPYIAPVTSTSGPQPAKYVPPFLRGAPSSDAEALSRLRRQVQGLLNRLSEANLVSILREVEELYRNNARQHVTSTLVELLLGIIGERTNLMDTFIILHAGFIAALYKIIGTDFGAEFIQRTVQDFDTCYADEQGRATEEKQTVNLISLLSELYNFQVVGANLIFDYIRIFLNDLSEPNTELLLKIIRNSGTQLRQDDPTALKDIVLLQQQAVNKVGEANLSVRTKFMIETINNLKNNRMKTGVVASTIVSEHTVRMKKILGSLNTRTLRASEPLRIGLKDIRDRDKRGKWWLVGASWKNEAEEEQEKTESTVSVKNKPSSNENELTLDGADDLLQLAREQRMNTDVRRAIFVAIMSASDYRDAHSRLLKLHLKRAQEVEIPKVILHCAGAEDVYNPYYTLIARKLCAERRLRMAFQFSLWDLFKLMGEQADGSVEDDDEERLDMRQIVNLARLYGVLIAEGGLSIGVLKTLDPAFLQPQTKLFVEVMLVTTILHTQRQSKDKQDQEALLNVFTNSKDSPEVTTTLRYLVKKVVNKADVVSIKAEKETIKWACQLINESLSTKATAGII